MLHQASSVVVPRSNRLPSLCHRQSSPRLHTVLPASRRDASVLLGSAAAVLSLVGSAQASPSVASLPIAAAVLAGPGACTFEVAPNGLQFCDLVVGTGPEPKSGTLIKCHYTGRLARNNEVFDSSYERGRPLTFTVGVGQVIKGWDLGIGGGEGIPPMKQGGKRRLLIPAELGYGQRGAGGQIKPGDALLFDVELLPLNGGRR